MIDIKNAIEQSKKMENVSAGGSQCFDFGDVVLVKYVVGLKYVKECKSRARSCEEEVMEGVAEKVKNGVNTPRHLAVARVIEGNNDVCYVLQEKSKGKNCASMGKYNLPYDQTIAELEFVNNIPFEHYQKLASDSCQLYEMGYEKKNKNLFYDQETGFWFIDFLCYKKENSFDENDPQKIFEVVNYVMPNPRRIASIMDDESVQLLSSVQREKKELLENSIEAKTLLAIKKAIPRFERYEKFHLWPKSASIKKYFMEQGLVKKDLFKLEDDDYPVFDELYENAKNRVISGIVNDGVSLWSVEVNEIRNKLALYNLDQLWLVHKDNFLNQTDYESEWDYSSACEDLLKQKMLDEIVQQLECSEKNENINAFLEAVYAKHADRYHKK